MDKTETVKHQYSSDKNLAARINLHDKHSTNKQGWIPWLFGVYEFAEGGVILELGCGNGMQWKGRSAALPPGSSLILSDFSEGMLSAARENLALQGEEISFRQIDIQDIPFASQTFDTVIANHMLYHVPNLDKALLEVRRVLKKGGRFYASTISGGGIRQYMHDVMKKFDPDTSAFTQEIPFNMENGSEILGRYFPCVARHDYIDSLAITETGDLMAWLQSSMSVTDCREEDTAGLYEYFEKIRVAQGAINIPKEACLFACIAE